MVLGKQYRELVETRLEMVTSEATNESELRDIVFRYGEFISVEKAFYTLLIDSDVKSDELEVIFKLIKPTFDGSWPNNDTAMQYGNKLWDKFAASYGTLIRENPNAGRLHS